MESRASRGRGGRMFSCFRPDSEPNVAVSGSKLPAEYSDGDGAGVGGRRKDGFRRRLSRVLRNALFETSLTKKIRDKRPRKTSFRSTSSLFADREQIQKVTTDDKNLEKESFDAHELLRIDSSRSSHILSSTGVSSSPSSSSCSSSMASNSRTSSQRKRSFQADSTETKGSVRSNSFESRNQNSTKKGGFYGSTIGLCLLLEVLMVLILRGKICAILCTSMWLFCFSRRRINGSGRSVDSPEYKKRVITAGLLCRSQSSSVGLRKTKSTV